MPSFGALVPAACVVASATAVFVAESLREPGERQPIAGLGAAGLIGAMVGAIVLWDRKAATAGVVTADNFGLFVTVVLAVVGLFSLATSDLMEEREETRSGLGYALVLLAIAGMMLAAAAADLVVIVLALEFVSFSTHGPMRITRRAAVESHPASGRVLAAWLSTACFLCGIVVLYSVVGSTRLDRIGGVLAGQQTPATMREWLAISLLIAGFGFKVSAVPFHVGIADAYEGASPALAGLLSAGGKVAAFAAFTRVFLSALEPLRNGWRPVLAVLAVATMMVGTVAGMVQPGLKRMLACFSIAHGGYVILALLSANDIGKSAILFYFVTYAIGTVGAFAVVALVNSVEWPIEEVRDYAGLWHQRPGLAVSMTIFLLSLAGVPPLGGFWARWYALSAAIKDGHDGLVLVGVLTSMLSAFVTFRVVATIFSAPGEAASHPSPVPTIARVALVASAGVIVYLGIRPGGLFELASASISTIF